MRRGETPSLGLPSSTLAPASIKKRTDSRFPSLEAQWRGERPSASLAFMSRPSANKFLILSKSPLEEASFSSSIPWFILLVNVENSSPLLLSLCVVCFGRRKLKLPGIQLEKEEE